MAKKVEYSVEEKLRAMYDLQLIDSRIDKIRSVRGELPLEVEDLEDEVEGLDFRINKINEELSELENGIKEKQNKIEESKAMITKYNDQQKNVRNNRAFESLSKEIEFQELEIQYSEKQIHELKAEIEEKKEKFISLIKDENITENIRELLKYDEDSAGGLMAKELISVNENWSVLKCLREIRKQAKDITRVHSIYVLNKKEELIGRLSLKDLIMSPSKKKIKQIYLSRIHI